MLTLKEDDRPRKGGWAPGSYHCQCHSCGEFFIGDKRAITCADCAYGLDTSKIVDATITVSSHSELKRVCEEFIYKHQISCAESCYQMDSTVIAAPELVEAVCNVLGYYDEDTDTLIKET